MDDALPTVWPLEPHTAAKHAILKYYLQAWAPIMTSQAAKVRGPSRPIRFIDGFAGPGVYAGGEDGSPLLAIKAALQHDATFHVRLRCQFIEKDPRRFESLCASISKYQEKIDQSQNILVDDPINGDCRTVLHDILEKCEKSPGTFGPALGTEN